MNARVLCAAVLLLAGAPGCGPEASPLESPEALERQHQELASLNGISINGLSANGLSANGLSANGLSANGLLSSEFASWFSQAPGQAHMLMTYLVRCAVPSGQSRTYTHAATGQSYTWTGGLGLTPHWATGQPATPTEQQVITACLLAHVNQAGANMNISVLGRNAVGQAIPYTLPELLTFSVREACFFGNVFSQQGLFFGVDAPFPVGAITTRACTTTGGSASSCAPLQYVGSCLQRCQEDPQGGPFYKSCTYNGETYRTLTTRMRQFDYRQLLTQWGD